MVKNLFFALGLFFSSLFSSNAFGNTLICSVEPPTVVTDSCNIPPPSNFHATDVGYNFISVSWIPTTANADHQLTLFQKNSSNGWDSLYSVVVLNSINYTFTNLTPGATYKYRIKTMCPNSNLPAPGPGDEAGPTSLILDLTIGGFAPTNPVPQSNCTGLKLPDSSGDWVGFKVAEKGTSNVTLFEFEPNLEEGDPLGSINRVQMSAGVPALVAANLDGLYPNSLFPSIQADLTFIIGKVNGSNFNPLGHLFVTLHPASVDICKDLSFPWNPFLLFTPLVLDAKEALVGPNIEGEVFMTENNKRARCVIQNPVNEFINLKLDPAENKETIKLRLTDLQGRLWLSDIRAVSGSNILIPTSGLQSGIYILTVDDNLNFKVVVSH